MAQTSTKQNASPVQGEVSRRISSLTISLPCAKGGVALATEGVKKSPF